MRIRTVAFGLTSAAVGLGVVAAGVRAPAQEAVGQSPAVRQGAPAETLKRLGKSLDPVERLQTQVVALQKEQAAQKAEISALRTELAEARRAHSQFTILDGHPEAHITKSDWDRMPGGARIRVRPR